jgi:hypothetical protein
VAAEKKNDPGTAEDGPRRRYVIGVKKIPKKDRDRSDRILGRPEARWRNIMNADDDSDVREDAHLDGLGGPVAAYYAELTDDEVAELRRGESSTRRNNVRYIEEDQAEKPSVVTIPPAATLSWLGASLAQQGSFTGSGVKVGVLDGGTTAAVRAQCSWTMAAKKIIPTTVPAGTEIMGTHGCLVTPEAVPPAGQLVEALIAYNNDGWAFQSDMAAGMIWAVDQGAQVINLSYGGTPGAAAAQVLADACGYARNFGRQITISAGNDASTDLGAIAALTRTFPNVHAIGAVRESDSTIASFSNRNADLSGVTPGVGCTSLNTDGTTTTWNGTSSAAPKAALLIAMGSTGGTYTPQKVADALRATARDLGLGVAVQGRGAWHLANALSQLATQAANPGARMKVYANALQVVPNVTYYRLKFNTTATSDPNVSINTNRDVFTINTAGSYMLVWTARWVGHFESPGDRYAALGPNIPWDAAGGEQWAAWSSKGSTTALNFTLTAQQDFTAGQQCCAWMWQSSGYNWGVEQQVAHADNRSTSLVIKRLGAA